jgi:hypothetical protein
MHDQGRNTKGLGNRKSTKIIYTGFSWSTPALAGRLAFSGQGPKKSGQEMSYIKSRDSIKSCQ